MEVGVLLKLTVLVVVPVTVKHNSKITVPFGRVIPTTSGSFQVMVITPGVGLPNEAADRPFRFRFDTFTNDKTDELY